jgi:rare lipoprotein A
MKTWGGWEKLDRGSALNKAIFGISAIFLMNSQAQAGWIGQASYYHHPRYSGMICAHRTLPFGTHLSVTNLGNGRSITVVVVDRGPFIRNRIIDVSTNAAAALGFRSAGIARVKVDVVEK